MSTGPVTAVAPDSALVDLRRPAVIAYFFKSQKQIDASDELAEVIDDLQHGFENDRREFARRGVQARDIYEDTLHVRWPNGSVGSLRVATSDSDFVGYRFFRPGAAPRIITEVMTDIDLLDAAREYFGWR